MTRSLLAIALTSVALSGCALNRRTTASPEVLRELWTEPKDLESRDLFYGPGGREGAPKPDAQYVVKDVKKTGTQPGYDLEDAGGHAKWSAKLGVESRVEVTVSRIVWAVGYHQPEVYYVPEWSIVEDGKASKQLPARFRREHDNRKKRGDWSWRANPFVGSRELAGLFTLMVIFNNWDIKEGQNAVYTVKAENGDDGDGGANGNSKEEIFMVRDLGASLGKSKWLSFGSKDDPDAFDRERFIKGVDNNRVQFGYQGSWLVPQIVGSVTPGDVRWVSGLLARLSDKQWHDAFRAGGFTDTEADRYIRRIKAKISEGLAAGRR